MQTGVAQTPAPSRHPKSTCPENERQVLWNPRPPYPLTALLDIPKARGLEEWEGAKECPQVGGGPGPSGEHPASSFPLGSLAKLLNAS